MAAQAQPAKVLRIGIIQDGKIVQERLIKQGESVLVGESAKNTFVLPKTHLPRAEFPLFVEKGGSYHLQVTAAMKGKVSSGGQVVALDKLRTDPSAQQQGGLWRIPLSEQDRGKLAIDNVTVLFQFVPPPPVQAVKPLERMDFRPAWFDEDDPAFFGFLALFAALAVVFGVGIYLAPAPPEASFDQYKDRFAQVMEYSRRDIEPKEREEREKPPEDLAPDRTEAKAKAEEKAEPEQTKAPQWPRTKAEAQDYERQMEAFKAQMRIVQMGTTGRSTGGTITDPFDGDVLESLRGVSGREVAVDGDPKATRGGDYGTDDIKVDENLDVGAPQASQAAAGPALKVAVDSGKGDTLDLEDSGGTVEGALRRYSGQLQACYEAELRADPSLEGRVEARFVIRDGRVTSAEIISNTSGNSALGDCVVSRIRRWRFDKEVNGPLTWSWLFRKR